MFIFILVGLYVAQQETNLTRRLLSWLGIILAVIHMVSKHDLLLIALAVIVIVLWLYKPDQ